MTRPPLLPATSPLRKLRQRSHFAKAQLTVLMPVNGYHVQRECGRALEALGHRVVRVQLGTRGNVGEPNESLDLLLQATLAHAPDFLLSVNLIGFDYVGWFGEVIDAIGLPTALWCVDAPFFIGQGWVPLPTELCSFFSWDKSFLPELRRRGFSSVVHLPLATDPEIFKPLPQVSLSRQLPLTFVGHSLSALEKKWRGRLSETERMSAEAKVSELLGDRMALLRYAAAIGPPISRDAQKLAYANFLASRHYRQKLLSVFPQRDLHLFGDEEGWHALLPKAHAHGSVEYGEGLRDVFCHSEINFNATNLQMPRTVNQRVFDVPASGAFLLTDEQDELKDYFEPNVEMAVYRSAEEARALYLRFRRDPKSRARMVGLARKRILAEHTYVHRVAVLVESMRARFAQAPAKEPRQRAQTVRPAT